MWWILKNKHENSKYYPYISDQWWWLAKAVLLNDHIDLLCHDHGLIHCKILQRIHCTNAKSSRICPTVSDTCKRCNQSPATHCHMFWSRPKLANFFDTWVVLWRGGFIIDWSCLPGSLTPTPHHVTLRRIYSIWNKGPHSVVRPRGFMILGSRSWSLLILRTEEDEDQILQIILYLFFPLSLLRLFLPSVSFV